MIEESFLEGDSVIHRLDPRAKVITAVAFSIVVALSDRFVALLPSFLIALSFVFLAGLSLKRVCLRLLMVNLMILMIWLSLPFTINGETLFSLGPLTATREGICRAAVLTVKSNAIILTLMAFIATMPVFTLGRALMYFHIPEKIVYLLSFTYRYIHVIHMEYSRLVNAIKIRGFDPRNNLHTYRTFAYIVGMLLLKSYERANRVRTAMLCRGFRGKFYDLNEFSFRALDWMVMFTSLFAILGIGILQWTRIID
ncbi:MAG: cobalt ECF transporter T component CbiQ [Deltaproteobacteria bacterium]|nr:cobalt ECF transporter T component CbiQ [Deltaproteobacteria bacterium]